MSKAVDGPPSLEMLTELVGVLDQSVELQPSQMRFQWMTQSDQTYPSVHLHIAVSGVNGSQAHPRREDGQGTFRKETLRP